jgi:hypothetical protein
MTTERKIEHKLERRIVPAALIEVTPGGGAVGHWLLASPILLFLGWLWVDLFHLYARPTDSYTVNGLIGLIVFVAVITLPLGLLAHRLVLSFPRLFHNAGWDVQPLTPVAPAEQYLVRYRYVERHWATLDWRRAWLRAGQGWVFLEMAVILLGAILMIPLYFSAREFGFGQ